MAGFTGNSSQSPLLTYLSGKSLLHGFALRRPIRDEAHVGISRPDLVALEERVPRLSFGSFGTFIERAAQRAEVVRETGPSPAHNWVAGVGEGHEQVLVRRVGDFEGENHRMRAQSALSSQSRMGHERIFRLEEPAST